MALAKLSARDSSFPSFAFHLARIAPAISLASAMAAADSSSVGSTVLPSASVVLSAAPEKETTS